MPLCFSCSMYKWNNYLCSQWKVKKGASTQICAGSRQKGNGFKNHAETFKPSAAQASLVSDCWEWDLFPCHPSSVFSGSLSSRNRLHGCFLRMSLTQSLREENTGSSEEELSCGCLSPRFKHSTLSWSSTKACALSKDMPKGQSPAVSWRTYYMEFHKVPADHNHQSTEQCLFSLGPPEVPDFTLVL